MQRTIADQTKLFGYYIRLYRPPNEIADAVRTWTVDDWPRAALLELFTLADHTSVHGFQLDSGKKAVCVPSLEEATDLVAWGVELGTAYSELTDPVEQRRRLHEQSLLAAGGDPEAMELDEDFLQAMEYAMPPTGGLGMGIDRLVMLITGRSIRETLPFPLAKPH